MTENKNIFIDYILLALMITFVTFQPYFKYVMLNYYELGRYLPLGIIARLSFLIDIGDQLVIVGSNQ